MVSVNDMEIVTLSNRWYGGLVFFYYFIVIKLVDLLFEPALKMEWKNN